MENGGVMKRKKSGLLKGKKKLLSQSKPGNKKWANNKKKKYKLQELSERFAFSFNSIPSYEMSFFSSFCAIDGNSHRHYTQKVNKYYLKPRVIVREALQQN